MHATLFRVSGNWWTKVEELRVSSPPPRELVVPRPYDINVRDFIAGEEVVPEIMEVDRYTLWRVWENLGEATYVLRVQESER